ncbi:uncharacterized protein ACA1_288790 [Acanthamoeba castellanii str. Neff]|uniref:COX assembly mitochondrial protein n=1 Tax=Acanthamoeba castellanii (strain ATCC 30010 / Neff) TaxID=1257118 RepID=L8HKH0_ACACF|nr:uncharacterized protein ACA1_288790 [Acanthamoeba castellanii str. Neff]ELR25158.1 hypothetical protein ACA1_288790 [Acanthamoeba castellanii str. Neff]
MHPPLAGHPMCRKVILELDKCHKERTVAKFFGACNAERAAVDACLQEEYNMQYDRRNRHRKLRKLKEAIAAESEESN